ncbi:MAG: HAAS signaling domain-containing protein [Candidatus Hodarchaeales archaeon]
MIIENEELVAKFLEEIKKHLPEWLKSNDEKVEDILLEISSHIWDSACEIAGSDDPDSTSIQEAINRLGTPREIAKSYKTRGTPKYFISEELWSTYTKVIHYFISIIFIVIVIVQVVLVEPNNLLQALINGITTSYPIIITFLVIVTAIFICLSKEGYFPKDLISQDRMQDETKEKKSVYYRPDEFLFNGLVDLLLGLFIIILPIDMINLIRIIVNLIIGLFGYSTMAINSEYVSISMELRIWLTLIGIVTVIAGITNLLKIKTKDIRFQLNMNLILIISRIVDFGLGIYILANLHLFSEVLPLPENILLFLGILGIVAVIIDIIMIISKNINLYGLFEEEKDSSLVNSKKTKY